MELLIKGTKRNKTYFTLRTFDIIFEGFLLPLKKKLMKILLVILAFFSLSVFVGCRSENRDHARAYVEGTITGNQLILDEITIHLSSDGKKIAETISNSSGEFVLSGPLLSDSFSLVFNKKIKSFSTLKKGCTLSADAKQIQIPAGITYITFNEIILEK